MQMITQVLFTDLDGTFVGDKQGLQDLLEYYKTLPEDVTLIYVTGRHRESALELIKAENLPIPAFLITDVGTRIYKGPHLEEDSAWTKRMNLNWEPEKITQTILEYPSISPQALPTNCRVSFYMSNEGYLPSIKKRLTEKDLTHKLIYSSGRDLDILPEESGKGSAIQYIIDHYVSDDASILIAGDSGNDLEMLTIGYPSVIVANAQPELQQVSENDKIFRASQNCAAGILEAWQYFYSQKTSDII